MDTYPSLARALPQRSPCACRAHATSTPATPQPSLPNGIVLQGSRRDNVGVGVRGAMPETTTAVERLGRVLYWLGCGAAGAIVVLGVLMLIGEPRMGVLFAVAVLTVALLVWLAGRACRYVLSGY
jgi:hypothetical protein